MVDAGNSPASRDIAYMMHPYSNQEAHKENGPMIIEKGEGIWVIDDAGKRYIEGMAGLWCTSLGYGEQRLIDAAIKQMQDLPYYHLFASKSTNPSIDLAEMLVEMSPIEEGKVFFNNSGSEANDTVVKLVWYYNNALGRPKKKKIISRIKGYHGVTVAAASMTGLPYNHIDFDLPIANILHTDCPHYYRFGLDGESEEEFASRLADNLEKMILEEGPDTVAAFIAEPIMGAGGVIVPPATYFDKIQAVLKKYDVLMVADEVICGFGRTGSWFGHQTMGIKPDLVPMAKGLSSGYLPISALAVSDKVADVLIDKGGEFTHGYTYSGHPAACAVALRNIEIMEREHLVEKVRDETGPYLAEALAGLSDHPLVGQTRTLGLLGAVEICKDKKSRQRFADVGKVGTICRDHIMNLNAISRACGDTMVVSPPLIIEKAQIDDLVTALRAALDATATDVERLGL